MNLIREFERTHDIRLPEELVQFYTEIGDGCENCIKRFEELEIDVSKWKEEFVLGIQPCNPKRTFLSWFEGFIEDVDFFEGFL